MKKRIFSAILATVMLVSFLAACGSGKDSTDSDTTTSTPPENHEQTVNSGADSTEPQETEAPEPTLEDLLGFAQTDYEDYVFHMLIANTDAYEHLAEDLTGDIINDAVFARNLQVEEYFQIDLEVVSKPCDWGDRTTFTAEVSNQVLSGDPTWDMVVGQTAVMTTGLHSDYYMNVDDMTYMDLSKPWWVADQYERLEINGKLFSVFGDMNLSLYGDMHGIFFNAAIISENKLDDPYELVKNNTWTLDKMLMMAEQAGADLDGVAGVDAAADRVGMISIDNPMRAMLTSFGCELLIREENGSVTIRETLSEKHIDAYAKLSNAFADGNYNVKLKPGSYTEGMEMIAADRALFYPTYLNYISNAVMRDMKSDYGIVPYPKYDETQESYISQIGTGATCTCFPQNIANPELSAQVANYMGYLGKETLVSTYFETYLQDRLSRSPEMQEMLTLIRETATVNLTTAYSTLFNPGLLTWFEVSKNVDHGTALASKYKANANPAKKVLEKNIMPRFE